MCSCRHAPTYGQRMSICIHLRSRCSRFNNPKNSFFDYPSTVGIPNRIPKVHVEQPSGREKVYNLEPNLSIDTHGTCSQPTATTPSEIYQHSLVRHSCPTTNVGCRSKGLISDTERGGFRSMERETKNEAEQQGLTHESRRARAKPAICHSFKMAADALRC